MASGEGIGGGADGAAATDLPCGGGVAGRVILGTKAVHGCGPGRACASGRGSAICLSYGITWGVLPKNPTGAIAQLVEHLHGMQGVRSSSLLGSIDHHQPPAWIAVAGGGASSWPGGVAHGLAVDERQ